MHITQAPPPRCSNLECKQCDLAIGKGKTNLRINPIQLTSSKLIWLDKLEVKLPPDGNLTNH